MKPTRIRHIPSILILSVQERLAARSTPGPGGCILWTGAVDHSGYGKFPLTLDGVKRMTGAHRASWMAHRGDIQGDLVVDHLCRVRSCVNVDHMELVSNRVNTLRGDHTGKRGRSGKHANALLHSCGKHGRADGYLKAYGDGYTRWVCRPCAANRRARHRARLAAAA